MTTAELINSIRGSQEKILEAQDTGKITRGVALDLLDALIAAKVAEAKASVGKGTGKLYCKVSEKGACSVYGLQRMPVTLYEEQWERLLLFIDQPTDGLRAFLKANHAQFSRKPADHVQIDPRVVLAKSAI